MGCPLQRGSTGFQPHQCVNSTHPPPSHHRPSSSAPALVTNSYVRWPTDCAGGNIQKQVRARGEKASPGPPEPPSPNGTSHFHALSLETTGLETVRPWKGLPSQLLSLSRGLETAAAERGLTPPRKPGPAVEAWRVFLFPVGGLRSSWEGNRQQASAAELTPGSRHRASGSRGAASVSQTRRRRRRRLHGPLPGRTSVTHKSRLQRVAWRRCPTFSRASTSWLRFF